MVGFCFPIKQSYFHSIKAGYSSHFRADKMLHEFIILVRNTTVIMCLMFELIFYNLITFTKWQN